MAAENIEERPGTFETLVLADMEGELDSTSDPEVRMEIRRAYMARAHAEGERRSLDDPTSGRFEVRMRDLIMNSPEADADGLAADHAAYERGERIEPTPEDRTVAVLERARLDQDQAAWAARFESEHGGAPRYGEMPEQSTDRARLDAIIEEHREATRRVAAAESAAAEEAGR